MDLGIAGKKALVCAACAGLGRGCALALAKYGVAVTITARTQLALEAAADQIARETGAVV
jgi:3-oxoacyl-[acyl-carrier protein] reductase